MAKYSYLNEKPKWYQPKPEPRPAAMPPKFPTNTFRAAVSDFGGVASANPIIAPVSSQPITPVTPTSKLNQLETTGRPAYFNNINNPNHWASQFTEPEKALQILEQQYQDYKTSMEQQTRANEEAAKAQEDQKKTLTYWMGTANSLPLPNFTQSPVSELDPNSLFGQRLMQDRSAENTGRNPDKDVWLNGYKAYNQNRTKLQTAEKINLALEKASPIFLPITDEQGNVVAPAAFTPQEYMKGIEDGDIYDPDMPESNFKYGKTSMVFASIPGVPGKQLLPAEVWYRSRDHLLGGNWNLPLFSDTEGYQYNAPMMSFGSPARWLDIQNFRNLKDFENRNKGGVKEDGTPGLPNQGLKPGFVPGIDFLNLPALTTEDEFVDQGEETGGDGGFGGGGGGGGGGFGPSYWGNPSSSGYYGNTSFSPGYWGNNGGYGSSGYNGSGSYSPNYQSNQYGTRKGQYFSQLARWVI